MNEAFKDQLNRIADYPGICSLFIAS
jgi:hypothetical protein